MQVDILLTREFFDAVEALEHETDAPPAVVGAISPFSLAHRLAIEPILAAVRVVEQANDVQER